MRATRRHAIRTVTATDAHHGGDVVRDIVPSQGTQAALGGRPLLMPGRPGGRIVIVRCGATELYEHLKAKFAGDELTVVIYDRRTGAGAGGSAGGRRRREEAEALARRGFYVIRPIRARSPK